MCFTRVLNKRDNRGRHLLVIVWGLCFVSLLACTASVPIGSQATPTVRTASGLRETIMPQPNKPTPAGDWNRRWLQHVPCEAPCFEGVTPGNTTIDQATQVWQFSPIIGKLSIWQLDHPILGNTIEIAANWLDESDHGAINALAIPVDQQVIIAMRVTHDHSITIGDVLNAYGQPSHIEATGFRDPDGVPNYFLAIEYVNHGFVISERFGKQKPHLNDALLFSRLTLFTQTDIGKKAAGSLAGISNRSRAWEGMKDFAYYCTDDEGGAICNRP